VTLLLELRKGLALAVYEVHLPFYTSNGFGPRRCPFSLKVISALSKLVTGSAQR
jgi:hypothetical protein